MQVTALPVFTVEDGSRHTLCNVPQPERGFGGRRGLVVARRL